MKIIIAGGSGFIGSALTRKIIEKGGSVTILTRNPESVASPWSDRIDTKAWDAKTIGPWAGSLEGADAVINLVGESIGGKRWSSRQKSILLSSRVDATNVLVEAMRSGKRRPRVFVSASAVGYYGNPEEGEVTEDAKPGTDFLAGLCQTWEQSAAGARELGIRVVIPRIGIVLGKTGGALPRMLLAFRLFAGGPLGSGRQWFPWVHHDDLAEAISFAVTNEHLEGPVNVAAPGIVRMKEFCGVLGRVLHRPSWAPVPALILRLGLGEMSSIVLTGQRVIPGKLLETHFAFRYPQLGSALENILQARK
ncbi:MAG TPA: TIGR01777 family oxidoreductase [Bacteroidota bacterium]|nr:TIGR01777 family oxidoreductase [Bacteroidota bacterium]